MDSNDAARTRQWVADAVTALRQGRADLAELPVRELAARFPKKQDVQVMQRWAAVLAFDWPAAREVVTVASRNPPAPDAVDLVLFHIDLPDAPGALREPVDYLAAAGLTFEAAMQRAPKARRILITDHRTAVPANLAAHEVVREAIDAARPMYERMRVQERCLANRPAGRVTVFMDVDVVPNRDPAEIFAEDFDVGLTWRPDVPDSPINGGLILVGPGAAGRTFFQRSLACYDALASRSRLPALFSQDLQAWWGDQFAWGLMVGIRNFVPKPPPALVIDGVRVRLLPAAEYNFAPDAKQSYSPEFLARRRFLHFKGNRKTMQETYVAHMRGTSGDASAREEGDARHATRQTVTGSS